MTILEWYSRCFREHESLREEGSIDGLICTEHHGQVAEVEDAPTDSRGRFEVSDVAEQGSDASSAWGQSRMSLRRRKVSAVRRQLRQERYDIDSRLATVLDTILEDLLD